MHSCAKVHSFASWLLLLVFFWAGLESKKRRRAPEPPFFLGEGRVCFFFGGGFEFSVLTFELRVLFVFWGWVFWRKEKLAKDLRQMTTAAAGSMLLDLSPCISFPHMLSSPCSSAAAPGGVRFVSLPSLLQSRRPRSVVRTWLDLKREVACSARVCLVAELFPSLESDVLDDGEQEIAPQAPAVKPKTGKAALPLKRDRVSVSILSLRLLCVCVSVCLSPVSLIPPQTVSILWHRIGF
jgi:hypothetical protein